MFVQVDRRHDEGADRRRGEVDELLAVRREQIRIVEMRGGRCRVENHSDVVELGHINQSPHTVCGGRHAQALCPP
jgi:hypothetical protein